MATYYTTVEKLRGLLSPIFKCGANGTGYDEMLSNQILMETHINGAESFIDSETFRDFRRHDDVVEFHDGNGKNSLISRYHPILKVNHLIMYNQMLQSMRIFLDTELIIQPEWGEIWLPPIYPAFMADKPFAAILGNIFIAGNRNIELSYSWGFDKVPEDIQYAALLWSARNFLLLKGALITGGAQSTSIDGYSESFSTKPFQGIIDSWEKEALSIISKWKRLTPKSV
jgi:hypothetical protein